MTPDRRLSRKALFGAIGAVPLAFGTARAADNPAYTLRANLAAPADSMIGIAAARFATAVNRRSGGKIKVELYPNLQLAKDHESMDALASGVIDLLLISSPWMVQMFPRYQVFELPFLMKDLAAGYRVIGGPVGQELFGDLEAKGIIGLGWGTGGFREIETVSKAVVVPEDMKGIRMRIPSSAIYVATYQALGAIPVPIDQTEQFVALQQRTVDGTDVNLDVFVTNKYYAICKHVAFTNHAFSAQPLLGSKRKIEALPSALQSIIRDEGRALFPFWKTVFSDVIDKNVRTLRAAGVTFSQPQYAAFRKAVEPIYAAYQPKIGDLLDRVNRAANG